MHRIHEATPIILTEAERRELEGFVRSTKTEYRLRQRAQIILLAAEGTATRAIGRKVGCTTGTASKWRVRYAERRLGGLDETGNRGNTPKYTTDATRRILRVLDLRPPDGYGRLSERLSLTINVRSLDRTIDRQSPRRCRSPPSRGQASSMSGACSEHTRSTLPRAKVGAKATIPNSPPKPPRWLAFIWRRPRTPS